MTSSRNETKTETQADGSRAAGPGRPAFPQVMAVAVGFEPTEALPPSHAFEVCTPGLREDRMGLDVRCNFLESVSEPRRIEMNENGTETKSRSSRTNTDHVRAGPPPCRPGPRQRAARTVGSIRAIRIHPSVPRPHVITSGSACHRTTEPVSSRPRRDGSDRRSGWPPVPRKLCLDAAALEGALCRASSRRSITGSAHRRSLGRDAPNVSIELHSDTIGQLCGVGFGRPLLSVAMAGPSPGAFEMVCSNSSKQRR